MQESRKPTATRTATKPPQRIFVGLKQPLALLMVHVVAVLVAVKARKLFIIRGLQTTHFGAKKLHFKTAGFP